MHNYYIGWDNGVTGTLAIIGPDGSQFIKTPVKLEQSYTIKKQNISRLEVHEIKKFFRDYTKPWERFAVLERPLVNPQPMLFKASMSAMRTLEAQILILESLRIPYMYCDSKHWQRVLLPKMPPMQKGETAAEKRKIKKQRTADLKKASRDIGIRLFPDHEKMIKKHKDADGLLIAEWARRENF